MFVLFALNSFIVLYDDFVVLLACAERAQSAHDVFDFSFSGKRHKSRIGIVLQILAVSSIPALSVA